jgi:3-phosphoshikimate 1-carboxyvinyltransferase
MNYRNALDVSKLKIVPLSRPVNAVVSVPGSKSITNRALLLAALAKGTSTITSALFSDDTRYMCEGLQRLGVPVRADESRKLFQIRGLGGAARSAGADLFIGNAGTAARFLTAYLSLAHGTFRLDGVTRMRNRPIEDLLAALRQLGVDAKAEYGNGCPPVIVNADGLKGGNATIRGDVSSQYLSALLMVAPRSRDGVEIRIEGDLASKPYVDITVKMMQQWGVTLHADSYQSFRVPGGQNYLPQNYAIEPDASSASYFFAAAAVTGGRVTVQGLSSRSLQGDVRFVDVLRQAGAEVDLETDGITVTGPAQLKGVDVDMNSISDCVMTLAAIAPFAASPTTIRNVGNIRHKETDRLAALAAELARLGVKVEEGTDSITIHPAAQLLPAEIDTYDDHRMAMSFAVAGLRSHGITLCNPACVRKTFPTFFDTLSTLYGSDPA